MTIASGAVNLKAPHDSCPAAPSFRRVLGLVAEHVIGPRLIADHVVGVIGRLVSGRALGADTGRYGGDRPVDIRVTEKRQRIALAASAIDSAVRRCEEKVVGPPQQQLPTIDDKRVTDGWDID